MSFVSKKKVTLSRGFHFSKDYLAKTQADYDEYFFSFGIVEEGHTKIAGRTLGSENDVWFLSTIKLERKFFVAPRNIAIFPKISKLINNAGPIIIGGDKSGAIPVNEFKSILKNFPNSYELDRYSEARISNLLADYFEDIDDAAWKYDRYIEKKHSFRPRSFADIETLKEYEVLKISYVYDYLNEQLENNSHLDEKAWQSLMAPLLPLIFPKYIRVLQSVKIKDQYSNINSSTRRFIDLAMLDASGNLDIIQIKKPTSSQLLRKAKYRDNFVPSHELSGAIMQVEKYLFHLSKWGIAGEREITRDRASELPTEIQIRISNPKAMIIMGRDEEGTRNTETRLDLEVIRRKYSNILDILTYDDLLRRLKNTLTILEQGET